VEICRLDTFGSGQGAVMGSSEHGNESSGSVKGGEFLDQLSDSFLRTLHHGVSYLCAEAKLNSPTEMLCLLCAQDRSFASFFPLEMFHSVTSTL
jgi:hypothetical protein